MRVDEVEERLGGECLGPKDSCSLPRTTVEELKGDDGVECGLPDHCLTVELAHRPLVVGQVVEVHLTRRSIDTGTGDPRSRTGHTGDEVANLCGVREARSDEVSRRYRRAAN